MEIGFSIEVTMVLLPYLLRTCSFGFVSATLSNCVPSGWFGNVCQFKCNCQSLTCQTDGSCAPGDHCKQGWFGPGCQYVDLAVESSVVTSGKNISVVTDGDDDTCNTETSETLTLSWGKPYLISWLRLHAKNDGPLNNVTVQFVNESGATVLNARCFRSSIVTSQTLDIFCDLKKPVSQIHFIGESVKTMCSLYISGGRNVALKQKTFHSSNYTEKSITYGPELAVDGNTDSKFYSSKTCTATHNRSPPGSWSLILSYPATVSRYVLYNRDIQPYRLQGFQLTSLDKNNATVYSYTDVDTQPNSMYTLAPESFSLSVFRVNITGSSQINVLTLCEAEIYGEAECDPGKYGRECEHTCNCSDTSKSCFVSTGGCPSGCAAGYTGEICIKSCPPGKYGENCTSDCSPYCIEINDKGKPVCDRYNGSCYRGCSDGYTSPFCNSSCGQNTYGKECKSVCSEFCATPNQTTESSCNHISGECISGCQSGYQSPMCTEACKPGTYGPGCNFTCSEFCSIKTSDVRLCDHISGTCLHEFVNGYEYSTCTSQSQPHPMSSTSSSSSPSPSLPNTGLTIGICITVAGITVTGLVIIIIICYRKKMKVPPDAGERPYDTPDNTTVEEHMYITHITTGNEYQVLEEARPCGKASSHLETGCENESSEKPCSRRQQDAHLQSTDYDNETSNTTYMVMGSTRKNESGDEEKTTYSDSKTNYNRPAGGDEFCDIEPVGDDKTYVSAFRGDNRTYFSEPEGDDKTYSNESGSDDKIYLNQSKGDDKAHYNESIGDDKIYFNESRVDDKAHYNDSGGDDKIYFNESWADDGIYFNDSRSDDKTHCNESETYKKNIFQRVLT